MNFRVNLRPTSFFKSTNKGREMKDKSLIHVPSSPSEAERLIRESSVVIDKFTRK
jgi:hypothetical protein